MRHRHDDWFDERPAAGGGLGGRHRAPRQPRVEPVRRRMLAAVVLVALLVLVLSWALVLAGP